MKKMVKFEDLLNSEYENHKFLKVDDFKSDKSQCTNDKRAVTIDARINIFDLYYHINPIKHNSLYRQNLKYVVCITGIKNKDNMYIILSNKDIVHLIDIYKEYLTFDTRIFNEIFELFKGYGDVLIGLHIENPQRYWLDNLASKNIISLRNARIMRLRYLGFTYQQISDNTGCSSTRVAQIVKKVEELATKMWLYFSVINNDDLNCHYIEYLYLPRNIEFALTRSGIDTIEKLRDAIDDKSIEKVRNIGKKSIEKINDALNKYNNRED